MTDKAKHDPHAIGEAKRIRHAEAIANGVMAYGDICRERRAEYAAAVAKLPATDRTALNEFAVRMTETHGPKVRAHHNALSWPAGFLVSRYGEEVAHWPAQLSDADRTRMAHIQTTGRLGDLQALNGATPLPKGMYVHGMDEAEAKTTTTGE